MTDLPDLQASDVMSAPVFSIPPETQVDGIEKVMREHAIGALPVTDAVGRPVGIVTRGDLLRNLVRGEDACECTAAELMSQPLHCIDEATRMRTIADLFETQKIHHALVVSNGRLVGMVSHSDLARAAPGGRPGRAQCRSDTQIREAIAEKLLAAEPAPECVPEFSVCDGVVRFWGEPPTAEEIEAVIRAAKADNG